MSLVNFDMNLLVVLDVLLEERSVTQTGNRLGRTQPAISNSLKKLRLALDDPLLVRGPNGMVLTPKAVTLQKQVRDILNMTENCLATEKRFDPSTATGGFRISAPDRLTLPIMLPLLRTIRAATPGISVDLVNTGRDEALARLDGDRLDISVGWYDGQPPRFNAAFLFTDYLTCVARRGHPIMAKKQPLSLESVLSYPHLMVSALDDPRAAFDASLARQGLQRNISVRLSNFSAAAALLKDSDLVGVFAQRIANFLAREPGLTAQSLPAEIAAFDHYMVWHKRYDEDPRHIWLREQIVAAIPDR